MIATPDDFTKKVETSGEKQGEVMSDGSFGGYVQKHGRPPAFEASDGMFYSVDLYLAEKQDDDELVGNFAGALLFVRWSPDGSQPVGHLETPYLFQSDSRIAVRSQLRALSLHELKEHLEELVEARKSLPDW